MNMLKVNMLMANLVIVSNRNHILITSRGGIDVSVIIINNKTDYSDL